MNIRLKSILFGVGFSLLFFVFREVVYFWDVPMSTVTDAIKESSFFDRISGRYDDWIIWVILDALVKYTLTTLFLMIALPLFCYAVWQAKIPENNYVIIFKSIVVCSILYLVFNYIDNQAYLKDMYFLYWIESNFIKNIVICYILFELTDLFFVFFSWIGLTVLHFLHAKSKGSASDSVVPSVEVLKTGE
ncbi:hypothetical protein [Photobacterium sp. 1_MG-2023]|uniref:hypothetical protein n=1 Tax=Photobacterium sp. 1_MG-2023 TaxID=3062646 RepID=UPI0026E3C350|nr:hypothetical protein [Photobacterium sp. 1_MG-2023]MDO6705533.1 hypothetical protein [Photobacterium sp. 1_MG-2023]